MQTSISGWKKSNFDSLTVVFRLLLDESRPPSQTFRISGLEILLGQFLPIFPRYSLFSPKASIKSQGENNGTQSRTYPLDASQAG